MTRLRWFLLGAGVLLALGAGQIGSVVTVAPISGKGTAQDPIRVSGLSTSGNATTATALAANGANCTVGSYPLGVNASGAVEDCTAVSATETDPQVGTLTASKWCTTDGTQVNCATTAPVLVEVDPKVGTLTPTRWCTADGTHVNCDNGQPVLVEDDPEVGTITSTGSWCTTDGTHVNCATSAPVTTESDPTVTASCGATEGMRTKTACTGALVHVAGTETVSGDKTFSGALTASGTTTVTSGTLWMTPAAGTGSVITPGARSTAAVGYHLQIKAGTGLADTDVIGTAGGVMTVYGGTGGATIGHHAGAAGGAVIVAGGTGGDGDTEYLPGAGGALYLSGGPVGASTKSGNVAGSHVYLDSGPIYGAGDAGSIFLGSTRVPKAISLNGPITLGSSSPYEAGGVLHASGSGAAIGNTGAGTQGYLLMSNAASAPSWTTVGAWQTATLGNSWENYGSGYPAARYRKGVDGRVYLSGCVKTGTSATVAFTLPSGYRPSKSLAFPADASGNVGRVIVSANGDVAPNRGANADIYLDSVAFYTDQ